MRFQVLTFVLLSFPPCCFCLAKRKAERSDTSNSLFGAFAWSVARQLDRLEKALADEKIKVAKLTLDLNSKFSALQSRFDENKGPAFTATFKTSRKLILKNYDTIKFSNTMLNRGSAYDPSTGFFKAPKSGIYMVSTTVRAWTGGVHFQLAKNNGSVHTAYANSWKSGTINSVLRLKKGDRIYVRHYPYQKIEEMHASDTSMFSVAFISK